VPSFAERVYALVRLVPRGSVITYGAIARVLGEPGKAREVGWAMAVAPDESGIPAHRVINARGEISGGGHPEKRRKQLEADGVVFQQDGRIDLDRYLWLPADAESGSGAPPGE
jgi:methylated-DNA-protein-cysteine methyltransferase-like protein